MLNLNITFSFSDSKYRIYDIKRKAESRICLKFVKYLNWDHFVFNQTFVWWCRQRFNNIGVSLFCNACTKMRKSSVIFTHEFKIRIFSTSKLYFICGTILCILAIHNIYKYFIISRKIFLIIGCHFIAYL